MGLVPVTELVWFIRDYTIVRFVHSASTMHMDTAEVIS